MNQVKPYIPGISLSLTIAAAANFLSEHYGAPVMLFAILIGMSFNCLMKDSPCTPGIELCSKKLLRIGVALLGFRVTLDQITSLGTQPILFVFICVFSTIAFGILITKLYKKSSDNNSSLGLLTGGSVAICGASAALAISLTLPNNAENEKNTLFTVITVTVISTICMILYPVLFKLLSFDDTTSAMLIGLTIHDVAQVVGAGFSISDHAGEVATYIKLLRVALLPIVVISLVLYFSQNKKTGSSETCFPWFAVAFVALLTVNSFNVIPTDIVSYINQTSKWFLVIAISALGVKTSLKCIADCGLGHIMIIVSETIFLLGLAIALFYFQQ